MRVEHQMLDGQRDHGMSQGPSPGLMLIVVLLAIFTVFLDAFMDTLL
jgi:hypothetical protein